MRRVRGLLSMIAWVTGGCGNGGDGDALTSWLGDSTGLVQTTTTTDSPTSTGGPARHREGPSREAQDSSSTGRDDLPPDVGIRLDVAGALDVPADTLTCSADLRRVIWASSGLLHEACGPEEGCFEAACIPACEAAALTGQALGCDYLIATPAMHHNVVLAETGVPNTFDGPCHALWISNTWPEPAKLHLDDGGMALDVGAHLFRIEGVGDDAEYVALTDGHVPPKTTALLLLSHRPGVSTTGSSSLECPRAPAILEDRAPHGTQRQRAIGLRSELPVHVQDILPFGGARSFLPSASLLYPVSAWGTNAMVVTPASSGFHYATRTWFTITASAPANVDIRLTGSVLPLDGEVLPEGDAFSVHLEAGEVVQFMGRADLSGSVVDADVPVGVSAGNTYLARVSEDSSGGPRDTAHQQLPHVRQLSNIYIGPGIPTRRGDLQPEIASYRMMAPLDGTELVFDPPSVSDPLSLDAGDVVELDSRVPFVVSSVGGEPFSFTQYMTGRYDEGDPLVTGRQLTRTGCLPNADTDVCPLGDTDWVHPPAPAHFSSQYTFALDPTYGTATAVLLRDRRLPRRAVAFSCGAEVSTWVPVGDSDFEIAYVDLFRYGASPSPETCHVTHHHLERDFPFGLMVWGLDEDASYGFAAGGALHDLNDVWIPAG